MHGWLVKYLLTAAVNGFRQSGTWFFLVAFAIAIACYHYFFADNFFGGEHYIGGDYSYFLPSLLNGYYWFKVNGLMIPPWFTPAFCGGLPYLPNPQVMYYSVPQFLTFLLDPTTSIYLTFLVFGAAAYLGFYCLSRNIFLHSREVAAFGATVFLFNGFYLHRMLMGHLTYHAYMLIPALALLLLKPEATDRNRERFNVLMAAVLLAYIVHSGAVNFIIPIIFSIIGVWLIFAFAYELRLQFWWRLAVAGLLAGCLSVSRLVAAVAFMANAPRDFYPLPGVDGFGSALLFVLQTIFFSGAERIRNQLVNTSFPIDQGEFAFGITVVPLIVLIICAFVAIRSRAVDDHAPVLVRRRRRILLLMGLAGLLLLPVAVNTYTPAWNGFLKSVPYINSSSLLTRWIAIDIPLLILIVCVVLDKMARPNLRFGVAVTGIAGVIFVNAGLRPDDRVPRPYNPTVITEAYYQVKSTGVVPPIKNIGVHVDQRDRVVMAVGRNDALVKGISQLFCYEPVFGYWAEQFPIKSLHPGPAMARVGGYLNIKNPSCYLYAELNECEAGDHFQASQSRQADAFIHYRAFVFRTPYMQKLANRITIATVILMFCGMILFTTCRVFRYFRK